MHMGLLLGMESSTHTDFVPTPMPCLGLKAHQLAYATTSPIRRRAPAGESRGMNRPEDQEG